MLDILKNGKSQVLNLFFQNPEKEYYLAELSKILGKTGGSYKKILDSLVDFGIIKDERKGPLRYFKLDKNHFLYPEIKAMLSKTMGLEFQLKEVVNSLKGIDFAFIYGSVAQGRPTAGSDIDLAIISDSLDRNELIKKIRPVEEKLKREINYSIYTKDEIMDKIKNKNSFILNILSEPIINLKGNINDFAGEIG